MNLKIRDKFRLLSDDECYDIGLPPRDFNNKIYTIKTYINSDDVFGEIIDSYDNVFVLYKDELPYVVLLTPKTNYGRKKYELVFRRN